MLRPVKSEVIGLMNNGLRYVGEYVLPFGPVGSLRNVA